MLNKLLDNPYYFDLLKSSKNPHQVASTLAELYERDPKLLEDHHIIDPLVDLLESCRCSMETAYTLADLYTIDPALLDNSDIIALLKSSKNLDQMSPALRVLYRSDPKLLKKRHIIDLLKNSDYPYEVACGLAELHEKDPALLDKLLGDPNIIHLLKSSGGLSGVFQKMVLLYTTNPALFEVRTSLLC